MFQNENRFHERILAVILVLSFVAPAAWSSAAASEGCTAAVPLDLDGTFRGHGRADEKTSYFRLEVDEPGVVSVEISVPGSSELLPRLGLLVDECEAQDIAGRSFAVLERSATHLVLAVESPGDYYFRSGAQDPRRPLSEYRLTTSFYATSVSRLGLPDTAAAEEQVQIDPDPDSVSAAEGQVQINPDPDSLRVGSAFGRLLARLCRAARSDDHGDTSTCATPVATGRSAAGRLANSRGDDYDFFTFTLTELETVAIGTSGTTDTFGTLFDPWGRQLATDDDGGEGSNFLIVRTLSPGRYVVRVEGSWNAEGPYELGVERAGW